MNIQDLAGDMVYTSNLAINAAEELKDEF